MNWKGLSRSVFTIAPLAGVFAFCLLALISISSSLTFWQLSMFGQRPSLSIENASIELGVVPAGESRQLVYKISNISDRPIRILGSRMSCSCTSVENVPKSIPADDAIEIRARFHPTETQRDRYAGSITVFTDDPAMYQLRMEFEAIVVEPNGSTTSDRTQDTAKVAVVGAG